MKVVLYKTVDGSSEHVTELCDWLAESPNYVILSEPVDIEFVRIPKEQYAAKVLAGFDEREKAIRLQFANALAQINAARQEFLAIGHDEVAAC